jgi:hypothetical protein
MAFYIIWFILTLTQLFMIVKRFRFVESAAAKGPYILLTVWLLFSAVFYIAAAIYTRMQDTLEVMSAMNFTAFTNFLYYFMLAFMPAIPLYILHIRGGIHQAAQGNAFKPVMSQPWKRIVDWVLTGFLYIFCIVNFAIATSSNISYYNDTISSDTYYQLYKARQGLSHTVYSFLELQYLNVIVSAIVMFNQLRGRKIKDAVHTFLRLLNSYR